jgi:hypothetical protein
VTGDIEYRRDGIVVTAWRDGTAQPVTVRWMRWRDGGVPVFDIEIVGPFGVGGGRSHELFSAFQRARQLLERQGWILAVEGARISSRPAARQPEGFDGIKVVRLDIDGNPGDVAYELFDDAERYDCGTVAQQQTWLAEVNDPPPTHPHPHPLVTVGATHRILSRAVDDSEPLWVAEEFNGDVYSDHGRYEQIFFTNRVAAIRAGNGFTSPATFRDARAAAEHDSVRFDAGLPWELAGFPGHLDRLPRRLKLSSVGPASKARDAVSQIFPGSEQFFVNGLGRPLTARLVVMPAGTDLAAATTRIVESAGAAAFDPIILVVDGNLPRRVRTAIAQEKLST